METLKSTEPNLENSPSTPHRVTETPKETERHKLSSALDQIEKSDISESIKQLLDNWIKANIESDVYGSYADKIREQGELDSVKIKELIEIMADTYLRQHPDENSKYQEGAMTMTSLTEGMFDTAFTYALSSAKTAEQKKETEELLTHFKELASK